MPDPTGNSTLFGYAADVSLRRNKVETFSPAVGSGSRWTLSQGSLPPGPAMVTDGIVTGSPARVGSWPTLKVRLADTKGNSGFSTVFAIDVLPDRPWRAPRRRTRHSSRSRSDSRSNDGGGSIMPAAPGQRASCAVADWARNPSTGFHRSYPGTAKVYDNGGSVGVVMADTYSSP